MIDWSKFNRSIRHNLRTFRDLFKKLYILYKKKVDNKLLN